MTKKDEGLSGELDKLRGVRDELRLQLHLGAAEARDSFERLEKQWKRVETHVASLRNATHEDRARIEEAARSLAGEIRDGYHHLRELMKRRDR